MGGHRQVGQAPHFTAARYAGQGRFLIAVAGTTPDGVGHFLWPGGVPHGVQVAAHGSHEVLLSGMSMEALQSMRAEYSQWLAGQMMAIDESAVAELGQQTHGTAAAGHPDVHPDQRTSEWAQHLVAGIASGTHQVADVAEILGLVSEAAGAEVAFLAAAEAVLGPVGYVAMLVEIVIEVVEAFGTGRELCKREGFCYGVMWQVLGEGDHHKQFLDWPPDTADQRREAFFEGVAEGRAKGNDANVRGTVLVELARYQLHGSAPNFAALYVLNELWTRVRENEIANKDLTYPAPSDDQPLIPN
jgi:hypothetical protein